MFTLYTFETLIVLYVLVIWASKKGHPDIVKILIQEGANINEKDR